MEREDYDTAKEKKEQVDRIRQQVYDQLGVHGLLSGGGTGMQELRRSKDRSGHHPRVRNTPFTALSTTSSAFSGLEGYREGESRAAWKYWQELNVAVESQIAIYQHNIIIHVYW